MNLLDIVPGTGNQDPGNYYFSSPGEPFIYALIGFLIIFVGIVIIIGIIWLIGFILRKTDNFAFLKKHEKNPKEALAPLPATEVMEEDVPDEVKAAIIAAIMAYYTAEKPKCEFKVKRIKRL